MNYLRIFSVRAISGQIALLLLASILLIHVVLTTAFFLHDPLTRRENEERILTVARLVADTSASERPREIEALNRSFQNLGLRLMADNEGPPPAPPSSTGGRPADAPPPPPPPGWGGPPPRPGGWGPDMVLAIRLGEGYRVFPASPPGERPGEIGIELPDGARIAVRSQEMRAFFFGGPLATAILFIVISTSLLGLWAARALTAPLTRFADMAENFSLDSDAEPLPEKGPQEVRALARALNRMRGRVQNLVEGRTRTLAAVSHDLRTPITRLRLRAEFIENDATRTQTIRDLDQMRSMLDGVLAFLRDDRHLEAITLLDLPAALQQICDQFADMGHNVSYEGPEHLEIHARPNDLHRAVTNIVENATRFGTDISVTARATADSAIIEVADDGPGLADADKAEVLEPFVRADTARNMDDSTGFGLGLTIARAIAQAHGGDLSLHDRSPHGLTVQIALPLKGPTPESKAA